MARPAEPALVLGIDVGTQGVRAVAADGDGRILARRSRPLNTRPDDDERQEQDPSRWWDALRGCVQELAQDIDRRSIEAVSLVATSGTLVLCDASLRPLRPAVMWNDKRATREAAEVTRILQLNEVDLGVTFRPTFTLPKALWVKGNEPAVFANARHILSAGDWLLARLTGGDPVTDYTNCLKGGADLDSLTWPDVLDDMGVDRGMLPRIVAPGSVIGTVCQRAARELGLSTSALVVAGVTDANGAQVAAGAVLPGRWVTTIGTGTSLKGVSSDRIRDPRGALYCHRQWDGAWVASVTSHCGAGAFAGHFPDADLKELTSRRKLSQPSSVIVFPLATRGEFFPVWAPEATRFVAGTPRDDADLFRGFLEGVAFVERLAVNELNRLGAAVSGAQVTMGGGARNSDWMAIRASVLGREVNRPAEPDPAYGAALLALGGPSGTINETVARSVQYLEPAMPDPALTATYDERFADFLNELETRGYLHSPVGSLEGSV